MFSKQHGDRPPGRKRVTYRKMLLVDILHYTTPSLLLSSLGSSPLLTWILRIACLYPKFILLPVAGCMTQQTVSCLPKTISVLTLRYGIKVKHDRDLLILPPHHHIL